MAYFVLKPGYSSAFRDAIVGLASLNYDPSASQLRITSSILYVICRDGLGRVVGQLELEDCCCIDHTNTLFSDVKNVKGFIVSPLNLMEHLQTSMLDLQSHHLLIVDMRLHPNDNEEPLVLLGNHEPISRFTFFFPNFQEIEIHDPFWAPAYPSLHIPASVCLNTAINLGEGVNFHMVVSLSKKECTINNPNGQDRSRKGVRLTQKDAEIKLEDTEDGQVGEVDVDVEVYGLLPMLLGCRNDGYMLSAVVVPLYKCFPLCIQYQIF